MSWYASVRTLLRGILPLFASVRVHGIEHIPPVGAFFLIANHQSLLDPILVQCSCPRPLHTFTKSSQFKSGVFRWILPRVNAIPVRRYQVDPQAVRVALRRLRDGEGVCIYPEGERSWDGAIQPLRRGTVRLLLAKDLPVVPAWISGSYDVWPRWSRRPRRGKVVLRFGKPLHFGRHDGRKARDRGLEEAERRIRAAFESLAPEVDVPHTSGEPGYAR